MRALTRVATADNESSLPEFAQAATASQMEGLVRAWRRVDRQEEAEEERLRHERRYVSLYLDEDGSWTLRGRLDPEVGALLEKALGLVAEQALVGVSAETPSTPRRAVAKQADRFQVVLHVE
ncbi:MAG TPA: hypothetical protein VM198_13590 [Longimicrobiales bacterium]|nr:hypothetical protein [Longimicrobiales bacterium]